MTLKLQRSELHALIRTLASGISEVKFATEYEYNLSRIIFQNLLEHLTKRALSPKDKYSIKISELHVYLLTEILMQIPIPGPYEGAIIRSLIEKIDKECHIIATRFNLQNQLQRPY